MSNKHTPGPWKFETVRTQVGICHKIGEFKRSGRITCGCVYDDYAAQSNPESIELMANARLMAAAPDLLAALQEAIETINAMSCKDLSCDPAEDVSTLEAAIAKATGANHNG